jgi:hypothetical protein
VDDVASGVSLNQAAWAGADSRAHVGDEEATVCQY